MKLFEDLLDDIEAKVSNTSRLVVDSVDPKCVPIDELTRLTNNKPMIFTISILTVHATDRINVKRVLDCINETFVNTSPILKYTFTNLHTMNSISDLTFIEWELPYYLADSENVIENKKDMSWYHILEVSIQVQWDFETTTQREILRLLKRLCKFAINENCATADTYILIHDDERCHGIKIDKRWLSIVSRQPRTILGDRQLRWEFNHTFHFNKERLEDIINLRL